MPGTHINASKIILLMLLRGWGRAYLRRAHAGCMTPNEYKQGRDRCSNLTFRLQPDGCLTKRAGPYTSYVDAEYAATNSNDRLRRRGRPQHQGVIAWVHQNR